MHRLHETGNRVVCDVFFYVFFSCDSFFTLFGVVIVRFSTLRFAVSLVTKVSDEIIEYNRVQPWY